MKSSQKLKELKIAVVITTYSKVSDAKKQMDIIHELWEPLFKTTDIYHEYNGEKAWYPEKYKESHLHRHTWLPHLEGAMYLMNKGIQHVLQSQKKYDYIVVASADVWIYNQEKIAEMFIHLYKRKYQLATSLWNGPFFSTEFFIISPKLAKKVFPLNIFVFKKWYPIMLQFAKKTTFPLVETYFTYSCIHALKQRVYNIYLIPGRRFVLYFNRFHSEQFYLSHHNLQKKEKLFKKDLSSIHYYS